MDTVVERAYVGRVYVAERYAEVPALTHSSTMIITRPSTSSASFFGGCRYFWIRCVMVNNLGWGLLLFLRLENIFSVGFWFYNTIGEVLKIYYRCVDVYSYGIQRNN